MAIETFTWCPRINPEQEVSFRTRKAQFGDGYAQVSGDG
ncbi:MAG: phage tail protein, partial [Enterobacteriaceae bacterium]|nr:phage tail protein [Enterobacteriaceae bacterium]